MQIFAENRKAKFNYKILETLEAGIVLKGYEVKSIKLGRMSLSGSYVIINNEEAELVGTNIPPYQPFNTPENYNPKRNRKLLLKKKEISYLIGKTRERGLTLVPLKVYTKNAILKIEIGVVKGKGKPDKREVIKKREAEREIRRRMKAY